MIFQAITSYNLFKDNQSTSNQSQNQTWDAELHPIPYLKIEIKNKYILHLRIKL